ncbi:cytochrome P450 [Xylaria flabelliformis]|nr:cytochrome P450 [Xylaria flabelliformis]KAI0856754.1 cytochrome P450 [Xylaria cubensis]
MQSSATIVLAVAAVLCYLLYSFIFSDGLAARKRALAHIPELRFEKDDTPDRYRSETRSLLRMGYEKYLRHGVPFQMHNPVGELGNQVILPIKYLDEVKKAPRSLYSFEAFSEKLFLLNYFNSPRQTDAVTYATKLDINRNLDKVINGLWTESEQLLKETVPATGWKTVPGGELTCSIVARTMSYVLVGPALCRNTEWQRIAIEATFAIVEASLGLRSRYTPNWRWLARWQDGTAVKLEEIRKKTKELIKPLYDERRQALKHNDSSSFYDTIYWIMNKRKVDKSLDGIVDQQLFLTLTSIHTTAGTLQSILFDWLDHPEYHAEIKAEINEALAEVQSSGGKWTLQRVAAMKKLDSFMKESTRINPVGFMTVQRYALKSHTFSDGFVLPAGTVFQFPMDAVHHDPNLYPDPDKFDAYRFFDLRERIDPNQFHYGFVSDMTLNWGAGAHACPGRFLAALVLKFALILLITRYEVKFEDGHAQKRPEFCVDNSRREDPMMKVALKARH